MLEQTGTMLIIRMKKKLENVFFISCKCRLMCQTENDLWCQFSDFYKKMNWKLPAPVRGLQRII